VEGKLHAEQLRRLLVRPDRLLHLPGADDVGALLTEGPECLAQVGFQSRGGVRPAGNHVGGRGAELDRVVRCDYRAEGVAEEGEPVEPEGIGEEVDVPGEDIHGERRGLDALATALAALVDVEDAELFPERIEIGTEHRMVEPGTAVQDDERQALLADLLDEELDAVWKANAHGATLSSVTRSAELARISRNCVRLSGICSPWAAGREFTPPFCCGRGMWRAS
jgi:hypothetical protein